MSRPLGAFAYWPKAFGWINMELGSFDYPLFYRFLRIRGLAIFAGPHCARETNGTQSS